jgi:hypothetical protein
MPGRAGGVHLGGDSGAHVAQREGRSRDFARLGRKGPRSPPNRGILPGIYHDIVDHID